MGELELHVTPTTILEIYNVLFWFYRVRPRSRLLEKLRIISEGLRIVGTSIRGIDIARMENPIPEDVRRRLSKPDHKA